jgi:hypothetical protein
MKIAQAILQQLSSSETTGSQHLIPNGALLEKDE